MSNEGKCPLFEFCQYKTAVCRAVLPDETCYWYRWFKQRIEEVEHRLTFGQAVVGLERKLELPELSMTPEKALKELAKRFTIKNWKRCNDCVYFDEPCFCMGQKGMPHVELDEAKRCEFFKLREK